MRVFVDSDGFTVQYPNTIDLTHPIAQKSYVGSRFNAQSTSALNFNSPMTKNDLTKFKSKELNTTTG